MGSILAERLLPLKLRFSPRPYIVNIGGIIEAGDFPPLMLPVRTLPLQRLKPLSQGRPPHTGEEEECTGARAPSRAPPLFQSQGARKREAGPRKPAKI